MKNSDKELKKLFETSFPFAKEAETSKEKVWENINTKNKVGFLWWRIAAIIVLLLLSATFMYLFDQSKSLNNQYAHQIEELKTRLEQSKQAAINYKKHIQDLNSMNKSSEVQTSEIAKVEVKWVDNIIYITDTVYVEKQINQQLLTRVDTVYLEKEIKREVATSHKKSSEIYHIVMGDSRNKKENLESKKPIFRLRFASFHNNTNDGENLFAYIQQLKNNK